MRMVGRMATSFASIVASSAPLRSSRTKVSRILRTLPSTLYTGSPRSFSIQKSSPIEKSFCCSWNRVQVWSVIRNSSDGGAKPVEDAWLQDHHDAAQQAGHPDD